MRDRLRGAGCHALGALALTLAATGIARAADAPTAPLRALVLPVSMTGDNAAGADAWDARLERRLGKSGAARLSDPLSADERRCRDTSCLARAARHHRADLVMRASIAARKGGYHLRLWLLRRDESQARYEESECAGCEVEAAVVRLDEMLDRVLAPPGGAGDPAVASSPLSPPDKAGTAGTVDGGESRPVDDDQTGGEPPRRPRWTLGAEAGLATGIAVGAVAVGIGAKLIHDQGRPTCDLVAPATECPRIANMQPAGIGMVVGGGALLLGSAAALAWIELRFAHPSRPGPLSLQPMLGPGLVGLSLGGAL